MCSSRETRCADDVAHLSRPMALRRQRLQTCLRPGWRRPRPCPATGSAICAKRTISALGARAENAAQRSPKAASPPCRQPSRHRIRCPAPLPWAPSWGMSRPAPCSRCRLGRDSGKAARPTVCLLGRRVCQTGCRRSPHSPTRPKRTRDLRKKAAKRKRRKKRSARKRRMRRGRRRRRIAPPRESRRKTKRRQRRKRPRRPRRRRRRKTRRNHVAPAKKRTKRRGGRSRMKAKRRTRRRPRNLARLPTKRRPRPTRGEGRRAARPRRSP
mmetsp:Transcript_51194/g.148955  ORF Transcript_51194/g.148955 Transcript_51194/m.148955 type:complete len:269 (-) Transcript_51194:84-890(-)